MEFPLQNPADQAFADTVRGHAAQENVQQRLIGVGNTIAEANTPARFAILTQVILELPEPPIGYHQKQTSLSRIALETAHQLETEQTLEVTEAIAHEFWTATQAEDPSAYPLLRLQLNRAQNYFRDVTRQVRRTTSFAEDKTESEIRFDEWQSKHHTINMQQLAAFEERGLLDEEFWSHLFQTPISDRHLAALEIFRDHIADDTSNAFVSHLREKKIHYRALENAVTGSLQRAAENPLRDQEKIQQILALLTNQKRTGQISMTRLIKVAHIIASQSGESQEFSSYTNVEDIRKAGSALLLILKAGRTNSETPEATAHLDNEDALLSDIVEALAYGITAEHMGASAPSIITVGELAMRYPHATPEELQQLHAMISRGKPPYRVAGEVLRGRHRAAVFEPGRGDVS